METPVSSRIKYYARQGGYGKGALSRACNMHTHRWPQDNVASATTQPPTRGHGTTEKEAPHFLGELRKASSGRGYLNWVLMTE